MQAIGPPRLHLEKMHILVSETHTAYLHPNDQASIPSTSLVCVVVHQLALHSQTSGLQTSSSLSF
jgi:hypothetical protein